MSRNVLDRRSVVSMLLLAGALGVSAQTSTTSPAPASSKKSDATFKDEELDQMLAPIALYPDSLLSQILMAATYPADVKEAVAWSKAHPDTKGDEAVKQVESQPWEPSVQSLVAFPQVLSMMGSHPDDVQRLGDAFLADPARVMDRVQFLRKKAKDAGNLKTTEQQKVSTQTDGGKTAIVIEPAQPSTVYVPVYQPSVVYGTWWYPYYPPYYWPPPPYYYGGAFVAGFMWGVAIGGINHCLWGGFGWGHGNVNINVSHYNNINVNRQITNNNNTFVHNASRRGDVPYRDAKSREQYGKKQIDGAKSRDAYRGKDGRDAARANASATFSDRTGYTAPDKGRSAASPTGAAGSQRASTSYGNAQHGSAVSGVRDSGASRANASRGQASRASASRSMPSRGAGGGGRHR